MTGQAVDAVQRSRAGQQSTSTLPGRLLKMVLLLGLLQEEQEVFHVTKSQGHSGYNKSLLFSHCVCVCVCASLCVYMYVCVYKYSYVHCQLRI